MTQTITETIGIAGSGAIATGLAAAAATQGKVVLVARSEASAERARAAVDKLTSRIEGAEADRVEVGTDLQALAGVSAVVEAIAEDVGAKSALLGELARIVGPEALICSTTSSLSVATLAAAAGTPERFVGLHVFNPVPRMQLVELAYADEATPQTRERARALCEALGKTPVDVPDTPGFVVNRLLFPYLFSAVFLQEESGLEAEAIDTCMKLGAGHPMGPLALLDFVGLDVSLAIGEAIGTQIPETVRTMVAEGRLGKKTGSGFYDYSR
jgi:3-hydroxybutyryl-CoA dehydrogenase